MSNCYMTITIGGEVAGTIVFELYDRECPKTTANFRQLCAGGGKSKVSGTPLHYKGSTFHRIIKVRDRHRPR